MPAGRFDPPPPLSVAVGGEMTVRFDGEDGRTKVFPLERIRLHGWAVPLGNALASRTGPAGALRTCRSAEGAWRTLVHFTDYLWPTCRPRPPTRLG